MNVQFEVEAMKKKAKKQDEEKDEDEEEEEGHIESECCLNGKDK